jgi:hypothetical protein
MFDSILQLLKDSYWNEESWSCSLMMDGSVMFSGIIAVVGFAGGLIMAKLALIQSASEPVVFYVHCFQFFRDIVVHHTHCSGVVGFHWCGWLFVA